MNEILNFIALLLLFICKYQLMSRNIVCDWKELHDSCLQSHITRNSLWDSGNFMINLINVYYNDHFQRAHALLLKSCCC